MQGWSLQPCSSLLSCYSFVSWPGLAGPGGLVTPPALAGAATSHKWTSLDNFSTSPPPTPTPTPTPPPLDWGHHSTMFVTVTKLSFLLMCGDVGVIIIIGARSNELLSCWGIYWVTSEGKLYILAHREFYIFSLSFGAKDCCTNLYFGSSN